MMFYLYFDKNGVLKECVQGGSLRVGDYNVNGLAVYCELFDDENLTLDDVWYLQEKPDGSKTNEISFIDNYFESAIPYDKNVDYRYFKDYKTYKFYYVNFNTENLDTEGLQLATVRLNFGDTLTALGEITFNVENNVIKDDNRITQSQYDYLITLFKNRNDYFNDLKSVLEIDDEKLKISGDIVPGDNVKYNIGDSDYSWGTLYTDTVLLNGENVGETFKVLKNNVEDLQSQLDNVETKIVPYTGSENITIDSDKKVSLNSEIKNVSSITSIDTARANILDLTAYGEENSASIRLRGSSSDVGTVGIDGDVIIGNSLTIGENLKVSEETTIVGQTNIEDNLIVDGNIESNYTVSAPKIITDTITPLESKIELSNNGTSLVINNSSIDISVPGKNDLSVNINNETLHDIIVSSVGGTIPTYTGSENITIDSDKKVSLNSEIKNVSSITSIEDEKLTIFADYSGSGSNSICLVAVSNDSEASIDIDGAGEIKTYGSFYSCDWSEFTIDGALYFNREKTEIFCGQNTLTIDESGITTNVVDNNGIISSSVKITNNQVQVQGSLLVNEQQIKPSIVTHVTAYVDSPIGKYDDFYISLTIVAEEKIDTLEKLMNYLTPISNLYPDFYIPCSGIATISTRKAVVVGINGNSLKMLLSYATLQQTIIEDNPLIGADESEVNFKYF